AEALLVRRAPRSAPRARTARARRTADGGRGWAAASRSCGAPRVAGRLRARALGEGVRAARGVHAPARRGALARAAARGGVGPRLREPLEHRRRLREVPPRADRP